jgi:hypothetical protein
MGRGSGLVDVLDRILDKGLVVAGDVKVTLADVELLTIRIRLIICSVDKAEKVGLDWWRSDPYFSSAGRRPAPLEGAQTAGLQAPADSETKRLEAKMQEIDAKLEALLKSAGKTTESKGQ